MSFGFEYEDSKRAKELETRARRIMEEHVLPAERDQPPGSTLSATYRNLEGIPGATPKLSTKTVGYPRIIFSESGTRGLPMPSNDSDRLD